MDGLVYVIVPIYNVEKYLSRCLDSIFNQTYKNTFIIAINDGSTDISLNILREYENKYQNIKVINKSNGGLSSARNAGLEAIHSFSNKTYIMFVDSDDYIAKDYIESLLNIMLLNDSEIVCSDHWWFDTNGCEEKHFSNNEYDVSTLTSIDACKKLFRGDIQSHLPTKLYKSVLWDGVFFDESTRFMEDQRLTFKLFLKTNRISYTNYPGYYYYSLPNSLTKSPFDNSKILDALDGYFEALKYDYSYEESELKSYAEDCFTSSYLMLFPRFNIKKASKDEIERFSFYKQYVDERKLVKKATFVRKKDLRKRHIYLMSPLLYSLLYKFHMHLKEIKK